MRRKRRNRGNWLPILGNNITSGADTYQYADIQSGGTQVNPSPALGPVQVLNTPVIPDFTDEAQAAGDTSRPPNLHDRVSGNAWSLARLVGKIHVNCTAGAAPGSAAVIWNNVIVCAAFYVARAADEDQNQPDLFAEELDPLQVNNIQNPWIWRRTWVLGNPNGDSNRYPQTNNGMYGSVADGPHIDSKVKRFINQEHRLWFICVARGWDPRTITGVSGDPTVQPFVACDLDLRVFGGLRRSHNTSTF